MEPGTGDSQKAMVGAAKKLVCKWASGKKWTFCVQVTCNGVELQV